MDIDVKTVKQSIKIAIFLIAIFQMLKVKKKQGKKFKRLKTNFQRRKIQGVKQILQQKVISDRLNITEEKINELEDIAMETNQDKTENI